MGYRVGLIRNVLVRLVDRRSQLDSLERGDRILSEHPLKAGSETKELVVLFNIDSFEEHSITTWHLNHVVLSG